jgi:hypothetical protein
LVPQVADLDGDGLPELLTATKYKTYHIAPGLAAGTWGPVQEQHTADGIPFYIGEPNSLATADWNDDGRIDLVCGMVNGGVSVVLASADGWRPHCRVLIDGRHLLFPGGDACLRVVDWDGDGWDDLVAGCGDGSVQWCRNRGPLADGYDYDPPAVLVARDDRIDPAGWRGTLASIDVVDWDGDGDLDILLGDYGDDLIDKADSQRYLAWLAYQRQQRQLKYRYYDALMAIRRRVYPQFAFTANINWTGEQWKEFSPVWRKAMSDDPELAAVRDARERLAGNHDHGAVFGEDRNFGRVWFIERR